MSSDSKIKRELVAERAPDRRVFELENGTRIAELTGQPTDFKDPGSGEWKSIDTRVKEVAGDPVKLESGQNAFAAQFDQTSSRTPFSIKTEKSLVGFKPVGALRSLPERDGMAGNEHVVHYRNLWHDTDARYYVLSSGVKEDLILKTQSAPDEFLFEIEGAKASLDQLTGGIVLASAEGKFSVPPPTVRNISGADVTAEAKAKFSLLEGGRVLRLSVDKSWLRGLPVSAFPLALDPTVFVGDLSKSIVESFANDGSHHIGSNIKIGSAATWGSEMAGTGSL